MPEADISFPRGGTKQRVQANFKANKDDNLFKTSSDVSLSQKKRKKKMQRKARKKAKPEEEDKTLETVIEPLTFKTLTVGVVSLACVVEVLEFEAKVLLPGGVIGKVPITNISQPYTRLLTAYAEDPNSVGETVVTLRAMFTVGQTLPCKILSKSQDPVSLKKIVSVSLDPNEVNKELRPSVIYHGMVLHSAVSSIEDHGYLMDIGIKSLQAFLSNKEAAAFIQSKNNGLPLAVGQLIPCAVDMPHLKANETLEGRTVLLTAKPSIISGTKVTESSKVTLHALVPGTVMDAVVEEIKERGLVVRCLDYPGCVLKNNLKNVWDIPSNYNIGQEVVAFVLYIHPITKTIYLSLTARPTPRNVLKKFGSLRKADIIEDAVVIGVESNCIYLKLNETTKAVAVKTQLSDQHIEHVKEIFSVGQTHSCRILSFDYFANMVQVTLKKSLLMTKHIPLEDLTVGAIFEGEVKRFVKSGAVVKLAHGIQGFVRDIHLSDVPVKRIEKILQPSMKVKCRILQVDKSVDPVELHLTLKKSLIYSKLPILSSYEDASPGLVADGVVVLINDYGLLVTFYNGVQGWVPTRELGASRILYPEKIFYIGQVVKSHVILCIPQEKKLKLSLKMKDRRLFGMKEMGEEKFQIGKIVNVKVKAKSSRGLDVEIIPSNVVAFLPLMHLSDHPANCQLLLDTYNVKDEICDVLCFSSKGVAIVSKKTSLMEAAKNGNLKHQFSDIEENITLPAVVKGFAVYGMFLETSNSLSGLVPKRLMIDGKVNNPADVGYLLQQSVIAKVTTVDHDHQRLELSTKLSDLYFRDTQPSLDLLQDYLADQERIMNYYSSQRGGKLLLACLKSGDIVEVKAIAVDDNGYVFELQNGAKGFSKKCHCGDKEIILQKSLSAVVLYVDLVNEIVELSLLPSVVNAAKKMKHTDSSQARIGQVIKCQALLIKDDFVFVSLGGHAVGQFAYLPTRRHLNDIWGRKSLYSEGKHYHLVVKRIYKGYILGVLKQHSRRDVEPLEIKNLPVKRKVEEETGSEMQKKKKTEMLSSEKTPQISDDYIPLQDEEDNISETTELQKKSRKMSESDSDVNETVILNEYNLTVGREYIAMVKEVKKFQLNVVVNNAIPGRVHITEVSNDTPEGSNPLRKFSVGQELKVCLIGFHHTKIFHYLPLSHRRIRSYPEFTLLDTTVEKDLLCSSYAVGQKVTGFVNKFIGGMLWIWLSPQQNGKINILNLSTDLKILKKAKKHFRSGQAISATVFRSEEKILELTKIEKKKLEVGHIVVGLLRKSNADSSYYVHLPLGYRGIIQDLDNTNLSSGIDTFVQKQRFMRYAIKEVDHDSKQCKLSISKSRAKPVPKDVKNLSRQNKFSVENNGSKSKPIKQNTTVTEESTKEAEEMEENKSASRKDVPRLNISEGFVWDAEGAPNLSALTSQLPKSDISSDSEVDGEENESSNKKKSKKAKKEKEKLEEEYLFKIERQLMDYERGPESVDDFDRLVLASPNSSIVWLQYMAFHLQQAEIDKARAVAERALKIISFREEQEKLNVWVALLNLENLYGTKDSLEKVFQRAVQLNEPLKVYNHLAHIYISSNKYEEAEKLYENMVRRFRQERQVWINFGTYYMKSEKPEASHKLMQRALKSLDKKDHIEVISKFAQMEFKYGDSERGKTMFESILSNYPKRTDLWSVYIDLILKQGNIEAVRHIFERVITLKLSAKKMKFFFKKYLDIEKEHGTEETVNAVKEKALEYVESITTS